jgi:hypothetical protein
MVGVLDRKAVQLSIAPQIACVVASMLSLPTSGHYEVR